MVSIVASDNSMTMRMNTKTKTKLMMRRRITGTNRWLEMTIHEFGKENERTIVLIYPSVVMWDYFEYVIPLMEKEYHLVIPALPGYDPDEKSDLLQDLSQLRIFC